MKPARAKNLVKEYGEGRAKVIAVNDVSIEVDEGEIVLIMGPSGSGKTTLLFMLGGLLRPTSGLVEANGYAISSLPEKKLPLVRLESFGFIFQDFNMLSSLTALENVEAAMNLRGLRGEAARERAIGLLDRLGLADRLEFLPEKLSGGEKQRVCIARALANEPKVILADEPTANLDSKSGQSVLQLMKSIVKEGNRAAVMVSHDPRILDFADRILLMEDGSIKEPIS